MPNVELSGLLQHFSDLPDPRAARDIRHQLRDIVNGIPSQDTFERVFQIHKPSAWQSRFLSWTQSLTLLELPSRHDEILAIDGKTSRHFHF